MKLLITTLYYFSGYLFMGIKKAHKIKNESFLFLSNAEFNKVNKNKKDCKFCFIIN